jgi:membrane fusion protein (multidrug efflux system)
VNPISFVIRRPLATLTLVLALSSGGVFALHKLRVDIPGVNTTKIYAYLDSFGERAKQWKGYISRKYDSYSKKHEAETHEEDRNIVVTTPKVMDVVVTEEFVCQIHSQNHINVRALDSGYLEMISVVEGQAVKKDDVMFKIVPILYEAKAEAELAEAKLAELEYNNTNMLFKQKKPIVSENEVLLFEAKLKRARAKAKLAQAELNFTYVKAPFDGIIDRLHEQLGSLIKEGDILTTLSDNSLMWVYFNVPEKQYLEYKAHLAQRQKDDKIELELANHEVFPQPCKRLVIEAQFNNETGNIPFRADFPNPDGLLRHGQTGKILIHRTLKNAIVIPQRAIFEILDKRYVWVVGEDDKAKQTLITIKHELDDIFVIDTGLNVGDKIVLEGVRQVAEGGKVEEYEFLKPDEVLKNQKFRAE